MNVQIYQMTLEDIGKVGDRAKVLVLSALVEDNLLSSVVAEDFAAGHAIVGHRRSWLATIFGGRPKDGPPDEVLLSIVEVPVLHGKAEQSGEGT